MPQMYSNNLELVQAYNIWRPPGLSTSIRNGLRLDRSKINFATDKNEFLGYTLSRVRLKLQEKRYLPFLLCNLYKA